MSKNNSDIYKREVYLMVAEDDITPNRMNISISMPTEQPTMSVKDITHLLIGGTSMMIKSCENSENGIKDYELLKEVMEHLNAEFASISSFDDLYTNEDYIDNKDEKKTMNKKRLTELLDANSILLSEIGTIIGSGASDNSIIDGRRLPWAFEDGDGMIYYARHEGDDIYEYEGFQVSSMGESDGITYVMGYDESENWDDTYILILDNKNKESLTIDE